VRLTLAAVAALEDRVGSLAGAGIVVGHGLATIETNVAYLARIRSAGAARAEPRRFPFTTPNASSGEAAIAFGLTGPSFAVGGGAHGGIEALRVAADLVRDGVHDRIIVVAADDAREYSAVAAPGTKTGAVALLVTAERAAGRVDDVRVRLEADPMPPAKVASAPMHAHAALLPFAVDPPAESVEATLPWGGFAKATVFWV
jgi:3-oxoacyl-[acyl-carrier-protein] synthase II